MATALRRTLAVVLTLAVLGWFASLRPDFLLGGSTAYIVVSGHSMEPTFYTGDLVIARKKDVYETGDIVAYAANGGTIIHRIIGGTAEGGYQVQGDNNDFVDRWEPTPDSIRGAEVLHIPNVGAWLMKLREPAGFGIAAAVLVVLFGGIGGEAVRRRRRRRSLQKHARPTLGAVPRMTADQGLITALAVAGALAAIFTCVGLLAFLRPASETHERPVATYGATARMGYTFDMAPSMLYPDGLVEVAVPDVSAPVPDPAASPPTGEAPADGGAAVATEPIYTQLANVLTVRIKRTLDSTPPGEMSGDMAADLVISAGEGGWQRTLPLEPIVSNAGSASYRIPLATVRSLISRIEDETGYRPGTYDIALVTRLSATGTVGDTPVDATFAPRFSFTYSDTQIRPPQQLVVRDIQRVTEPITKATRMGLVGMSLPVPAVRWISLAAVIVFGTAATLLAAMVFLGAGRDELGRIRARYRSMLLPVLPEAEPAQGRETIRVQSIHDLARLARRDGGIIFEEQDGTSRARYFVPDGDTVFEYRAGDWSVPAGGASEVQRQPTGETS